MTLKMPALSRETGNAAYMNVVIHFPEFTTTGGAFKGME
jgi:hypothetical protein